MNAETDGDDYLKGEDESFCQETRVSDEAVLWIWEWPQHYLLYFSSIKKQDNSCLVLAYLWPSVIFQISLKFLSMTLSTCLLKVVQLAWNRGWSFQYLISWQIYKLPALIVCHQSRKQNYLKFKCSWRQLEKSPIQNRLFSWQTQPWFQAKYQVISIAFEALRQVISGKFYFLSDAPQFINTSHFDKDTLV